MATAAYLAFEPADESVAREVGAELERNGWTATFAGPELRRDDAVPKLVESVGLSGILVLVASPASESSRWVTREVAGAINNGRPVIIVQTGPLTADSWISATLDMSRSIDFRDGVNSEALAKLIEATRLATGRGRVIAMLNIKGGVGKTVLAANLVRGRSPRRQALDQLHRLRSAAQPHPIFPLAR